MKAVPFIDLAKTDHERKVLTQQSSHYERLLELYEERIRQFKVSIFRIEVLNTLGWRALDLLPSLDDMVVDGKELTIENYLPNIIQD